VSRIRIVEEAPAPALPSRETIARLALDVYKLALDAVRQYQLRSGERKVYPQPDFKAACEALRVVNDVCGYGARGGAPKELNAAGLKNAEEALNDLRSDLAKRGVMDPITVPKPE
jgi:hypothetical protein